MSNTEGQSSSTAIRIRNAVSSGEKPKKVIMDIPHAFISIAFGKNIRYNKILDSAWKMEKADDIFTQQLRFDFDIFEVGRDNSSFFKGLSLTLFKNAEIYQKIRRKILFYMKRQPCFEGCLSSLAAEDVLPAPVYGEIQSASDYFHCPLIIYFFNLEHAIDANKPIVSQMTFWDWPLLGTADTVAQYKDKKFQKPSIYMAFHVRGYFSLLIPKQIQQWVNDSPCSSKASIKEPVEEQRTIVSVSTQINAMPFGEYIRYEMVLASRLKREAAINNFRRQLEFDFHIVDVGKDDTSFFKALAVGLYDDMNCYASVRREILCHMLDQKDRFHEHVNGSFKKFLHEKSTCNSVPSRLEIQAAAEYYKRPIFVHFYNLYHEYDKDSAIVCQMSYFIKDAEIDYVLPTNKNYLNEIPISVAFNIEGHFSALKRKQLVNSLHSSEVLVGKGRIRLNVPPKISSLQFGEHIGYNFILESPLRREIANRILQGYLKRDFQIINVGQDDSSFFKALGFILYKNKTFHMFIRNTILGYMKIRRNCFQRYISTDFKEFLNGKQSSNSSPSYVEIQAAADYYGRPIIIYYYNSDHECYENKTPVAQMCYLNTKLSGNRETTDTSRGKKIFRKTKAISMIYCIDGYFSALMDHPVQ